MPIVFSNEAPAGGAETVEWRARPLAGEQDRRPSRTVVTVHYDSLVQLVLASASPRRAELLTAAGFVFQTLAVDIDESPRSGEDPARYVDRLAREKSARGLALHGELQARVPGFGRTADPGGRPSDSAPSGAAQPDFVVLGADTTVVVGDVMFGKPSNSEAGARMLRELSGRKHQVLTGISLRSNTGAETATVVTTAVEFVRLTAHDIEWYLRTEEGVDKAGGYAIQGLASRFIARIEGSYANVVGLPVASVFELARQAGWAFENTPACR
jgi:septum formation protein